MSREDVRSNLVSWEADSARYQERNAAQLNRWACAFWSSAAARDSLGSTS